MQPALLLLRRAPLRTSLGARQKARPYLSSHPRDLQRTLTRRVLFINHLNSHQSLAQLPLARLDGAIGTMSKVQKLAGAVTVPVQARNHSGHSHGHSHGLGHHHHNHDNTYLTSSNRNDAGVRVTRLGLYVNVGMAVSKGVGGVMFNSQALVADAFHALTDLVSDCMTLATISVALKPPTEQYPNGFGKVESFGSLVVSGLLLTGGIVMCMHSGGALLHQFLPDTAHMAQHAHDAGGHSHGFFGHSHSAAQVVPDINAAWIAGGSIIVKEYLYRVTMKVAKERKSSVLASNAVHHRVDSLTSIVALVAIGGAHILNGATWLDPVGGLLVSLMVIQAGLGNTLSAIYELCDKAIDEDVQQAVARATGKALQSEDVELRKVQGIKAGQNYLVDIELAAPSTWTLDEMRAVEDRVRETVGSKVRGARRIRIRFVSKQKAVGDFADEFIGADVSPRSSPEPEGEEEHSHAHDHGHAHDHAAHKASAVDQNPNSSAEKRR